MSEAPKEGDERVTREVYTRRACDNCGEPATNGYWFLLERFRTNPASKAYGRDDCSWCSDLDVFSCDACAAELRRAPDGYFNGCTSFKYDGPMQRQFFEWRVVK